MVRRFITWFAVFGLSHLMQAFGWVDQGAAFVWLHFGILAILMVMAIIDIILNGVPAEFKLEAGSAIILLLVEIFIPIASTLIATRLFDVGFAVAYQIMTFGQCMVEKEKD
ncbi:MAG: hypothetical protein J6B87_04165 [Clostridia bacterium]|nr:hypothetical protein [Clostridia bacterium]